LIIQLGSIFGSLISGIGKVAGGLFSAAAPQLLEVGQQFLQREIQRKLGTSQRRALQGQAVQALNTPGIAVARLGGTLQPVGGRVQRSTFTPAALTPAQSPFGNVPLLPVGGIPSAFGMGLKIGPFFGAGFPQPSSFPVVPIPSLSDRILARRQRFQKGKDNTMALPSGPLPPAVIGEPRFARDQFGKTIMFVPSPRPGEGFITLINARQMGLSPTRPFWRFNRLEGQFEKIKPRRLNPFNFRATRRAGRRVERTLDAVKELVRIQKKMTSGKVSLKPTKKRK